MISYLDNKGVNTCSQRSFKLAKFDMRWKSENIIGLQIADLIAYPVTRHVLNPNGVNLAFDVLKKNIFQLNGKVYGMKIFPKEQGK